jgi:WD40 repeat protein
LDESDIFDIYTDHSIDEFGHGKVERNKEDLAIIESIYKRPMINARKSKNKKSECVSSKIPEETSEDIEKISIDLSAVKIDTVEPSNEVTKHLYLASCCKKGNLCLWRWGGILMVSKEMKLSSKNKYKKITHPFGAVFWLNEKQILAAAKDSQLVSCTFTDEFNVSSLHDVHKRGLFNVVSIAGSSEEGVNNVVWSVSMDRLICGYSLKDTSYTSYSTFGGYVYDAQISPIHSNILAVGCGDGMIRIWNIVETDGAIYPPSGLRQFWNGINGKILSVAWHPTNEKCLAFSTFEGKVGLVIIIEDTHATLNYDDGYDYLRIYGTHEEVIEHLKIER